MGYKIELRCKITAENGARLTARQEDEVHMRLVDTMLGEYIKSCGWTWIDSVEDTIVVFRDV